MIVRFIRAGYTCSSGQRSQASRAMGSRNPSSSRAIGFAEELFHRPGPQHGELGLRSPPKETALTAEQRRRKNRRRPWHAPTAGIVMSLPGSGVPPPASAAGPTRPGLLSRHHNCTPFGTVAAAGSTGYPRRLASPFVAKTTLLSRPTGMRAPITHISIASTPPLRHV